MCDVIDIFKSQSDGTKRLINSTLKVELHQSSILSVVMVISLMDGNSPKLFYFFFILQLTPQDKTIILDVQVSIFKFFR